MTWVIGASSIFGYGILVSDIRVSWNDRTYKDCLQKIHPVSIGVVGGFSGSVKLGLLLLRSLQQYLSGPLSPGSVWVLPAILNDCKRRLQWSLSRIPDGAELVSEYGCDLMLIGISGKCGDAPWPRFDKCVLSAPEFAPKPQPFGKAASIGSGSRVQDLCSVIDNLFSRRYHHLMQLEVNNPGGWAKAALLEITDELEKKHASLWSLSGPESRNVASVSPLLQLLVVWSNGYFLFNNSRTIFFEDREEHIIFPSVCTSWEDFERYCNGLGKPAGAAHC